MVIHFAKFGEKLIIEWNSLMSGLSAANHDRLNKCLVERNYCQDALRGRGPMSSVFYRMIQWAPLIPLVDLGEAPKDFYYDPGVGLNMDFEDRIEKLNIEIARVFDGVTGLNFQVKFPETMNLMGGQRRPGLQLALMDMIFRGNDETLFNIIADRGLYQVDAVLLSMCGARFNDIKPLIRDALEITSELAFAKLLEDKHVLRKLVNSKKPEALAQFFELLEYNNEKLAMFSTSPADELCRFIWTGYDPSFLLEQFGKIVATGLFDKLSTVQKITLVSMAASHARADLIELFVSAGVDLKHKGSHGLTLIEGIYSDRSLPPIEIMETLVKNGASYSIGDPIKSLARCFRDENAIQHLEFALAHGASTDWKALNGHFSGMTRMLTEERTPFEKLVKQKAQEQASLESGSPSAGAGAGASDTGPLFATATFLSLSGAPVRMEGDDPESSSPSGK